MSGAITAGTIATVAGIGAAGSIGGALIGANAAGNAASTQANAADTAAQLQYQASQNALGFQEGQWNQTQQNEAPWLQSGGAGLSQLDYMLGLGGQGSTQSTQPGLSPQYATAAGGPSLAPGGTGPSPILSQSPGGISQGQFSASPGTTLAPGIIGQPSTGAAPGTAGGSFGSPTLSASPTASGPIYGQVNQNLGGFGSLMQPYGQTFQAPTGLTEQNDPGYQARLQLGTDTLQHSAAARGSVLTGGTAKALDTYAQDYASNEYGNVYNRALGQYQQNYNIYQQNQANQYNRLASLAGVGQTAANTLSGAGQQAANNAGNLLVESGNAQASGINNAAAARASGYYNSANAIGGAFGGVAGNLSQLALLNSIYGNRGGIQSPLNVNDMSPSLLGTVTGGG